MGAFISKQPNGLYCRFSTVVDTITHYNMDEAGYIELCISRWGEEKGKREALDVLNNYLYPFQEVLDRFVPNNDTVEKFKELLKKMGYNKEFEYKY